MRATASASPCPSSPRCFERLAARGESLRPHPSRLLALLDDYGPQELARRRRPARSTRDALGAGTIAHMLETDGASAATTAARSRSSLPDHPGVRDLDVTPHRLETYDALTRPDPDDDPE